VWIRQRCEQILREHGLRFDIEWALSGQPFLSTPGALVQSAQAAISAVTGLTTELSTGGGTSDGRFIAQTGAEIVELGPVNATIHQIDEHIALEDIPRLTALYHNIMVRLLATGA
jgi:succinyl-diaminopimelate desuccinylase